MAGSASVTCKTRLAVLLKCLLKTGYVPAAMEPKNAPVPTVGNVYFMKLEFADFGTE